MRSSFEFIAIVLFIGISILIPQISTVTDLPTSCVPPNSVYNSTDKKYYDCFDNNRWGERLVAGTSLVALNNINYPSCLDGAVLVRDSTSSIGWKCVNLTAPLPTPTPTPTPIPSPTPTPTPISPSNYSVVVQLKINNFGFGFASIKVTPSISQAFLAQSDASGKVSLSFSSSQTYKLNLSQSGYNSSPSEIDVINQSRS